MSSNKKILQRSRRRNVAGVNSAKAVTLPKKSHDFVTGSSPYLTKSDADFGAFNLSKFAISCSVLRSTAGTGTFTICGQQNIVGTGVCFLLRFIDDKINFSVSSGGSTLDGAVETIGTYPSTDIWINILAIYDVDNATASQKMRLFVNGVEPLRTYTQPTSAANNSGAAIRIGKNGLNSAGGELDGYVYNWAFFSGFVPTAEQTSRQGITPTSLHRFTSLHSYLDGKTIVSDYKQTSGWTNVNSVELSESTPFTSTVPSTFAAVDYILQAPSDTSVLKPIRVIFHGSFGTASDIESRLGLTLTDMWELYITSPNTPRVWQVDAGAEEEALFVDWVVGNLKTLNPMIDTSKVYTGGHSNGGAMALVYANLRPDRVLGVTSFAGYVPFEASNVDCPVTLVHGTDDTVIPFDGNEEFLSVTATRTLLLNGGAPSVGIIEIDSDHDLDNIVTGVGLEGTTINAVFELVVE